jgi:DHA1 family multidrug resistance protein-like MFS transporter
MTGFYQVAYMVGLSISPIVGGPLADILGFREALRVCGIISGVGLAVALVALPETRPPPGEEAQSHAAYIPRPSWSELVRSLRKLDRRVLLAGYVFLAIFFVSNGVLMSTVSLYLGRNWGERINVGGAMVGVSSLAGVMLALRASLGIVSGPAAGTLSDWLRNRWPVVRGAILVGVLGFVVLALPAGIWVVPLGVGLVSMSAGALIAVVTAIVGDLATGNRKGVTMGVLATAGDIGSATGPLLAYALAVTVDLRWVYLFCAIALASGLLATIGQGRKSA